MCSVVHPNIRDRVLVKETKPGALVTEVLLSGTAAEVGFMRREMYRWVEATQDSTTPITRGGGSGLRDGGGSGILPGNGSFQDVHPASTVAFVGSGSVAADTFNMGDLKRKVDGVDGSGLSDSGLFQAIPPASTASESGGAAGTTNMSDVKQKANGGPTTPIVGEHEVTMADTDPDSNTEYDTDSDTDTDTNPDFGPNSAGGKTSDVFGLNKKKKRNRAKKDPKSFACKDCPKKFRTKLGLLRHVGHHGGKKYRCPHCSKIYWSKEGLRYHMTQYTVGTPVRCRFCARPCPGQWNRKQHEKGKFCLKKRFGPKSLPCPCPDPACGAMFTSKDRREMHLAEWHTPNAWSAHPPLEEQKALLLGECHALDLEPPASTLREPHPLVPRDALGVDSAGGGGDQRAPGAGGRRPRVKWTDDEVAALKAGVLRFGEGGEWKRIRYVHREALRGRTPVNLKDKWRNLKRTKTRSGAEIEP